MDLLLAFIGGVVAVPFLLRGARRLDWRAPREDHMSEEWLRDLRYVAAKRELRTLESGRHGYTSH